MTKMLLKKSTIIAMLFLADAVLLLTASWLSYWIRFNPTIAPGYIDVFMRTVLYSIPLKIAVYYVFGLYRSIWYYASFDAIGKVFFASFIGNVAILFINTMGTGLPVLRDMALNVPRGIYPINILLDVTFVGGMRISYRLMRRMAVREVSIKKRNRTLVIGAGNAGALIVKELKENRHSKYNPVAILDDDPSKWHRYVVGVPVVGGCSEILRIASQKKIKDIIVAISNLEGAEAKRIFKLCKATGLPVKKIPGVRDLVSGRVSLTDIRPIEIEDLLGRPSIQLDPVGIEAFLKGRRVLVTGGGGSIGSELCRQIASFGPETLYILDFSENYTYDIQQELKLKYPQLKVEAIIANIREEAKMMRLFSSIKPYTVFHAAAHKHVPLMEDAPEEAVKNNIFGTYNVVTASHQAGVKKFVFISTDKAVNPTNVMGATKRFCEMIIQAKSRESETEFALVRFGNVLGSNGSVIPHFRKQIAAGGPVTVTHKDIIRYFMTIPEAVQLVLQSASMAKGGEIFVLDMGEPVSIDKLARDMIKLSGYEPDEEVEIIYTGLRPGEKLFEELLMSEEGLDATSFQQIFVGRPMDISMVEIIDMLSRLDAVLQKNGDIKEELKRCICTYKEEENCSA